MVWILFVAGIFVGCVLGMYAMSLCVLAREADEKLLRFKNRADPDEIS